MKKNLIATFIETVASLILLLRVVEQGLIADKPSLETSVIQTVPDFNAKLIAAIIKEGFGSKRGNSMKLALQQ